MSSLFVSALPSGFDIAKVDVIGQNAAATAMTLGDMVMFNMVHATPGPAGLLSNTSALIDATTPAYRTFTVGVCLENIAVGRQGRVRISGLVPRCRVGKTTAAGVDTAAVGALLYPKAGDNTRRWFDLEPPGTGTGTNGDAFAVGSAMNVVARYWDVTPTGTMAALAVVYRAVMLNPAGWSVVIAAGT